MLKNKRIKVGDKVPVALNGRVDHLEVVRTFRVSIKQRILNFIALPIYRDLRKALNSQRVIVTTPAGEHIECRLSRPVI